MTATLTQPTAVGAIDIGGTKIAVAAVDSGGKILAKEEIPTAPSRGFTAAMEDVVSSLDRVRSIAGVALRGIGIGCTGPVDPIRGAICEVEFLPGWEGCNPTTLLGERFELGVVMENDADAAALGEALWGAGKGRQNQISVTVGTGIGGGILMNGALYRGAGGAHPEIGHHVIDSSGPPCFCGAGGCWEVLASGPALVRHFIQHQAAGSAAHTAASICAAARAGDSAAQRAVAVEGRYLGIGLSNLITLFMPEIIVLSGSVMESADLFLPTIQQVIDSSCGLVPAGAVELVCSSFGRQAPLIGAAAVWHFRNQRTLSC
ncbi:MAG: ROK family protein [Proteobacteria bacterium]|nr:ROK family protein [Pseudomonadota bacterium]